MQTDRNPITGFFTYSKAQQVVLLLLGVGILVFTGLGTFYPYEPAPFTPDPDLLASARELVEPVSNEKAAERFYFDPNTVTKASLMRLGLREDQAASWLRYRGDRKKTFKKPADIARLYKLDSNDVASLLPLIRFEDDQEGQFNAIASIDDRDVIKEAETDNEAVYSSFPFDPNLVTLQELQQLGLSERQAAGFVKYRSKAGPFRSIADVEKLRLLDGATKARLLPLVHFTTEKEEVVAAAENKNAQRSIADQQSAAAPKTYGNTFVTPQPYQPARSRNIAAVDINTATLLDLDQLPGIGEYRASKILNFREYLGGFSSVAQLGATRGIPDSVFQAILPYLRLDTPHKSWLKVNVLSVSELASHPYLSKRKAEAIVKYRDNHGEYSGRKDLEKVRSLKKEDLERLEPYISYEK